MVIVRHLTTILQNMVDDNDSLLKSFQYNDKPTANVKLDSKMEDITAILFQITDFELQTNRLTVREKADINISFLQKESKLDAEGYEQDIIIDNTKDAALDFVKRLMDDKTLRIIDDTIDVKSVYLRSDSNRTGVNINLKIEQKQGECL